MTYQKTSLLIPYQLPEFIRDNPDYEKFVLFLQAYYEWMEQNNNVIDSSKNILNYVDIDRTSEQFLNYFYNDFLQYFPLDMLADKTRIIKVAKELYKSKGTPAAYKFLFRILYNSDVTIFNTGDGVLRASSGKWYVAKSLKIKTTDTNFLNISNHRIFGESSKCIATIENSALTGNKIQIFISDISRTFFPGEYVRIVDGNNQSLYFLNNEIVDKNTVGAEILRSKIVSQISQININPNYRGQKYLVGDPVVVYNGLDVDGSIEASAYVAEATTGAIKFFRIEEEGYGYVAGSLLKTSNSFNSTVSSDVSISGALGAFATVSATNTASISSNATYVSIDTISQLKNVQISNSTYSLQSYTTNANTSLVNSLNFISFETRPIKTVFVNNGGAGIINPPSAIVSTKYTTNKGNNESLLSTLGILAPIQILEGGQGYQVNDSIIITGGHGQGAYANVTSVGESNNITGVSYVFGDSKNVYPLGGMGYTLDLLPDVTVNSSNVLASNASLVITGILGAGALLNPQTDRVGSITKITVENYGEDYVTTPNVSVRVQDILVANVNITNLPKKGDVIYQYSNTNSNAVTSFAATVDSIQLLSPVDSDTLSIYKLRVFDYSSKANKNLGHLIIEDKDIYLDMSTSFPTNYTSNEIQNIINDLRYDPVNGVLIYGDGTAKATAQYLNGIASSQGQYLDSTGQPSSFDVLQSFEYNNFTYELTVEKEIEKYRKVLLDLLHPAGLKVFGRYAINSRNFSKLSSFSAIRKNADLADLEVNHLYTGSITGDFSLRSSNTITFSSTPGVTLANLIFSNSCISIIDANTGQTLAYSDVTSISPDEYTNLLSYSQNFDRTWAKANLTIVQSATTAPDGSLGAYTILSNQTDGFLGQTTTSLVSPSTTYTFSVWMKADTTTPLNISLIDQNGNNTTACSVSNTWQRYSVTRTTPVTVTLHSVQIGGGNTLSTGEKAYIWGAQLDVGATANNYFPSVTTLTYRPSTGTYFDESGRMQTATANVARYQYNPTSLDSPPFLLAESAANNILRYSQDITIGKVGTVTRPWTSPDESKNVSSTVVTTLDPAGNLSNVYKVIKNKVGSSTLVGIQQILNSTLANVSNTVYTYSFFAKAAEVENIYFWFQTTEPQYPRIIIDLVSGKITNSYDTSNIISSGIISVGNGWHRCWLTANTNSGINLPRIRIYLAPRSNNSTYYTGNVGDGFYLWGAQAEAGYAPTSYIPTTASNGFRAADVTTSTFGIKYPSVQVREKTRLTFDKVAIVSGNLGSNVVTVKSLTGTYDYINNGEYSNTSYPLFDIVQTGDRILIANNTITAAISTVNSVDAVNGKILLSSNFTSNVSDSNTFMTINRNISENANYIKIYGAIGVEYLSELGTELGDNISTESGSLLTID